jgi:hypothetical protein
MPCVIAIAKLPLLACKLEGALVGMADRSEAPLTPLFAGAGPGGRARGGSVCLRDQISRGRT